MLRFNRYLSDDAFKFLKNKGSWIIPEIINARPFNCAFAFDIQIRENDYLMVYVGTTSVLKIQLGADFVNFSAHKTYKDSFLKKYLFTDLPYGEISNYLGRILPKVDSRYFENHKEGYYQNYLCYHLGEVASKDSPFIIFDRECVLGFDNSNEKINHLTPLKNQYQQIRTDLQEKNSKRWGMPKLK